ncbi:hypothetical protein [Ancylobacter sp. FA202]|uniref:COG3904 family protein n=1 Tax=Ancylobacter sp. FA202 TaxID=1111106 RepID=UPI00039F0607|nr:hypothetical protein [Ancylobacter sp. FA202]
MTAQMVGYIIGLLSINAVLTWFSFVCLRGIISPYLAALVSSGLVLAVRSLTYQGDFIEGLVLYAAPQAACLVLLLLHARRTAVRQRLALPAPVASAESDPDGDAETALSAPVLALASRHDATAGDANPVAADPAPAAKAVRSWNILGNYWRGYYSLGVTYWVFGAAIFAAVFAVTVAITVFIQINQGYYPYVIFGYFVYFWIFLLFVTIWQYVGVWRSANNNIAKRTSVGKKAVWANLAKLSIVFGTFFTVVLFIESGFPQLKEGYSVAFRGDPTIPDYGLRIMRNGTEVEITGGFKFGLTDDFLTILKASPQIKVVHLNSIGGRIGEGIRLSKAIREAGLQTYVSNLCASACTVAFAGGTERWMVPKAVLGFHGPAFPGMSISELESVSRQQSALMVAFGYDKAFVEKAVAIPSDDVWKPTLAELQAAHVVTDVSDGSDFALSGLGQNLTDASFVDYITGSAPILDRLKQHDPDEFEVVVEAYHQNYIDGGTLDDANDVLKFYSFDAVVNHVMSADDAALVDLGRLLIDELKILQGRNVRQCATFGASGGAHFRIQYALPSATLKEYQAIGARLVETATERPADDEAAVARMLARTIDQMRPRYTPEQISLLKANDPNREQAADFCAAVIGLYQAIVEAPQTEAAAMLRSAMGGE